VFTIKYLLSYLLRREVAYLVLTATAVILGSFFGHHVHL
jgi:hypothetical protein